MAPFIPRRGALAVLLALASPPVGAVNDDPASRAFAQTCLSAPYLLNPNEKDVQAHLRCSGKGESFCLELRGAYVGKRLPRLAKADVASACGGDSSAGTAKWLELRDAVSALVRGHSYTPAERAEVAQTIRRINLVYQRPGGPSRAELDALEKYYLNKAFVLSPEQDRDHQETASKLLAALEARLPQVAAGTLTAEGLSEWARFVEFVESYIITPGSGLAGREDFIKKFDDVAAFYDVHEYLTRRQTEKLAADRGVYFRDGRLTEAGQAIAREVARGRRLLRAVAHLDIADGMSRAPDTERDDWKEQTDRTKTEATRTAAALSGDERLELVGEFERSGFVRRRDDGAPPAPHQRMDPQSFPEEFPPYFVRAAPDRAALIYRFSESHFTRLGNRRVGEYDEANKVMVDVAGFSARLVAARRELQHYLTEKECPKPGADGREACEARQRARAEELVNGSGPFHAGLNELSRLASDRQRREEFWDTTKHFIPGYDCYALVAGWEKTSGGEKALEGGMCVLGVMPLARATARLGQTALSKAVKPSASGSVPAGVRPPVAPGTVAQNAALAEREDRVRAAMEQLKLNRRQGEAVAEAHEREGLQCVIYRCTKEQLEEKLRIMTAKNPDTGQPLMTPIQAKEAIRLGLAGYPIKRGDIAAIPRSNGGFSNASVVVVDEKQGLVSVTFRDEAGREASKVVSVDHLRQPLEGGLDHIRAGSVVGVKRLDGSVVDAQIVAIDDVRITVRFAGADGAVRTESARLWELRPPSAVRQPPPAAAPAAPRAPPRPVAPHEAEALAALQRQGVLFRHPIEHDGFQLTFSDFFVDHGGRVFTVVRVEQGDKMIHRVVYRSNSSAVFRYLPAVADGWYDKGYKLGEAALALPPKLQEHLGKMRTRGPPIEPDELKGLLPVVSMDDYYAKVVGHPGYVGRALKQEDDLMARVPRSLSVGRDRKMAEPALVQAQRPGARPDFGREIQTYAFETPIYGRVQASVYASKDGSLHYTLLKDVEGRVWFGDVRLANARIGPHAVADRWVESGELITPLWEYSQQLPRAYMGPVHPTHHYVLAWSYIRQFPDVRRYYAERGLRVPD